MTIELEPVSRLSRDLVSAGRTLGRAEARYLVDAYYAIQEDRIRSGNQAKALAKGEEPHALVGWLEDQNRVLEGQIRRALGAFADASPVGVWAQSLIGIGPVLSAGLLAHIEQIHPTVGHLWRFAGLDPTDLWGKGEKRPWNAHLRTLCWKVGESFVKTSGHEQSFYGPLYAQRKAREEAKNEAGDFAPQAAAKLLTLRPKTVKEVKDTLASGRLTQAHLHARAKRWAVKLFLSHYHHVAYFHAHGQHPPKPYVIEHLGHAHEVQVPNWPF